MRANTFRLISILLVGFLVIGTMALMTTTAFLWLKQQNETTQDLLEEFRSESAQATQELKQAERIALRTLRLEVRRLRLTDLLEQCIVLRLTDQQAPRCEGVRQRVHRLTSVIRAFRERLIVFQTPVEDGGGGGNQEDPKTVTRTRTVTPPPTVGNSDECPPKNPHC